VFPGWDDPALFHRKGAPIFVEYCSGNGAWIIQKAKENPEQNWIAVEKKFERVRKIWSKCRQLQLNNLLIVCGAAESFTKYYLPEESLDGVYVNFPDPWPKDRHAKHRLFQGPFIQDLSRMAKKGANAFFVTDDAPYCAQMVSVLLESSRWHSSLPDPYFVSEWSGYGTSYFDQLWRQKGRTIHYLHFTKK
jgi:tRNA (guanine-N7-)-methyltransferase